MTCKGMTKQGKPCSSRTKREFCYHHAPKNDEVSKRPLDSKEQALLKKISEQKSNLNILNKKLSSSRDKIAGLIIEKHDLEMENESLLLKVSNLEKQLDPYLFIKNFESMYARVKKICQSEDLSIIQKKFYERDARLEALFGENGHRQFHAMRVKRNQLVHSIN